MINKSSLVGLASLIAILSPTQVFAQTPSNIVIPTIEFSGDSTAFSFKVTANPNQQFVIGPVVISQDRFIFNGGIFNPLDLNVNLAPPVSVKPIDQATIDATMGKSGISSQALFRLARGEGRVDQFRSIDTGHPANLGLIVNGDHPILTLP